MAISLSNLTVNEATAGAQIGTLSTDVGGPGTFSLYFPSNDPFLVVNGSTLSLKPNYYLDYETKYFITNTSKETNGRITERSYTSYKTTTNAGDDPKVAIKFTTNTGTVHSEVFTLSVVNKTEMIVVTPTKFTQNQYGATIAQISATDNYFSGSSFFFEGPSFLEISGNELKFTDDHYYSEIGWVLNSNRQGWDLSASDYSGDLNLTMLSGFTTDTTDSDSDGNADFGYTKLSTSDFLSNIFTSSNINTTATISLNPASFSERDYGAIVATINYSGSETVSFSLATHTFFELTDSNKIKFKDEFFYNKSSTRIEDQNGYLNGTVYPIALQGTTANQLNITATNVANSSKLYTEQITIADISSSVFGNSNVTVPQITVNPVSFNDKKYGAVIASVNYSGSESPSYTLSSHFFLELTNDNKIKLKDTFFFDLNTGCVVKDSLSYSLANQGNNFQLHILAKDASSAKNLSSELITIDEIESSVFGTSNVVNLDESYTYVTDIKFQAPSLPKVGREEYQKNITSQWVLSEGEKISYSFLEPGAAYVGTYNELDGLISATFFLTVVKTGMAIISVIIMRRLLMLEAHGHSPPLCMRLSIL